MDKVKIQEIAEEAGLSIGELLDKAKELGFDVKAANSTISMENAGILVDYAISGTLPKGFKKTRAKEKIQDAKKKYTEESSVSRKRKGITIVNREKKSTIKDLKKGLIKIDMLYAGGLHRIRSQGSLLKNSSVYCRVNQEFFLNVETFKIHTLKDLGGTTNIINKNETDLSKILYLNKYYLTDYKEMQEIEDRIKEEKKSEKKEIIANEVNKNNRTFFNLIKCSYKKSDDSEFNYLKVILTPMDLLKSDERFKRAQLYQLGNQKINLNIMYDRFHEDDDKSLEVYYDQIFIGHVRKLFNKEKVDKTNIVNEFCFDENNFRDIKMYWNGESFIIQSEKKVNKDKLEKAVNEIQYKKETRDSVYW